jgi:hypothetical protein
MSIKKLQNSDNIIFNLNEDKEYIFTNIIRKYKEKKREALNSKGQINKIYLSKKIFPIKSDLKYLNEVITYSNIIDKENTFDSINDSRRSGFGGFKFNIENKKNEEVNKKIKQCHTCKIKNNFKQVHIYNIININNNIIVEQ